MNGTKPGYKTTEFWLTAAAVIVGLITASGALTESSSVASAVGLVASALASMGYSWSRGTAKADPGAPSGPSGPGA